MKAPTSGKFLKKIGQTLPQLTFLSTENPEAMTRIHTFTSESDGVLPVIAQQGKGNHILITLKLS